MAGLYAAWRIERRRAELAGPMESPAWFAALGLSGDLTENDIASGAWKPISEAEYRERMDVA
jgi:hypothetical protein